MSLTGKEALEALKTYSIYKDKSDYAIKKSIGKTKLATVDELKTELIKLQSKKTKKIKIEDVLVDDVIYELLLRSDIKELSHLCSTNKKNQAICQSESFWQNKLKYDNLPTFNFEDFEFLKDTFLTESDVKTWFNIYDDMRFYQKEAREIMLINAIEKSRLNHKTNGTFIVQMYGSEFDRYYIPIQLQNDIRKQLKFSDKPLGAYQLSFTLLENQYKLIYTYLRNNVLQGRKFTSEMMLTMRETLDLLTLMLFDQSNDINIMDENSNDFRYMPAEIRGNTNIKLQIRYALYETLIYLDKNKICKF